MSTTLITDSGNALAAHNGVPQIDFPSNLRAAFAAGRRATSILREVVALYRGPGRLSPAEYFLYRLWEPRLSLEEKRRFVGKLAQHPMHIACNNTSWYATAADKLLFHTLMTGARLPRPALLAITRADRLAQGATVLADEAATTAFLRDRRHYPLFAKPIDGKYSLSVISADDYDPTADRILLRGAEPVAPAALAKEMAGKEAGFVIQRRLTPDPRLVGRFGPCLWSVRVIMLLTPAGPLMHRAVAKIATGQNPADNFWRRGNMVGAIDTQTGQIMSVVQGSGADMTIDVSHPDTGRPITGTAIPDWEALSTLVELAARLFPGIRTQSWDIALTDKGPIPLEVNFGGDLNLTQLASGKGVLDDTYREHLRSCGYRF